MLWTKSYGPNYTKVWAFWPKQNKTKNKNKNKNKKKNGFFFNHSWKSVDAILEDVSVAETIVQC